MIDTASGPSASELKDQAKKISKVLERLGSQNRVYEVTIDDEDRGLVRLDPHTHRRFLELFDGEVRLTAVDENCDQNWIHLDMYLQDLETAKSAPIRFWFGPCGSQLSLNWVRRQASQNRRYTIMGLYRWPKPYQ